MRENNKIIDFYEYISEISKISRKIEKEILKEKGVYFLKDLKTYRNFKYKYNDDNEKIFEISKPIYLNSIAVDKEIVHYLKGDLNDFKSDVFFDNGVEEEVPEYILEKVNIYLKEREKWVEEQKRIEKEIALFNNYYVQFLDLNKNEGSYEIVVANGIVTSKNINYPILIKKAKLSYDAKKNTISLLEVEDSTSKLHNDFLVDIDGILLENAIKLENKLKNENYHPLERDRLDQFFREYIHTVHINGYHKDDIKEKGNILDVSLIIEDNPVFFIRKKEIGISKFAKDIIEDIKFKNEVPEHIKELVGIVDDDVEYNQNRELSEEDILFIKETNREQVEIAKKIENHKAVVVQGPPGTGKTHTIANLLGHFLSQGKNVLVTSHTKKALKVLKDKIPEKIQGLCISILEDNNEDMKKSVESISERMGKESADELKKEIDLLGKLRNEYSDNLKKIKKQMFTIKYKESNSIIYNGESFSVKDIGEYLRNNGEIILKIDGKIKDDVPCPINNEEFAVLKGYRENITIDDEKELKLGLIDSCNIIDSDNLEMFFENEKIKIKKLIELSGEQKFELENGKIYLDNCEVLEIVKFKNLKEIKYDKLKNLKEWEKNLLKDGAIGKSNKTKWLTLIEDIDRLDERVEKIEEKLVTKTIDLNDTEIGIAKDLVMNLKNGILKPGFLFKSNLKKAQKEIGNKILLDNKVISSEDECNIVLEYLDIQENRKKLRKLWETLILDEKLEEVDDNEFLIYAKGYKNKILFYLNWFSEEKEKFYLKLKEYGFNLDEIFKEYNRDIVLEEVKAIIEKIDLLEKIEKIGKESIELEEIKKEKNRIINRYKENKKEGSKLDSSLLKALEREDIESYKRLYDYYLELKEKVEIYNKRNNILEKINSKAEEWYTAIIEEKFDKDIVDIFEVWKWKSLYQKIKEMEKEPYEKLQIESKELAEKIKKITIELVEKKSWYHVLKFIEKKENLLVGQALRGWKQSVDKIGKGTGKNAEMHRKQAREKMKECQKAIPIWIMPMDKVIDTLLPAENKFDVIIVDEASQSDLTSLVLLYMAKKMIVVGDDKQVSPSGVGVKIEQIEILKERYLKGKVSNYDLYDLRSSLYSIASTTYPPLMLKEHFRCVPEIIAYSNKTSYDYKIKPLREENSSNLKPAVINYRVDGIREDKINIVEANTIVSLIKACLEKDEYKNSTFGVISLLGTKQIDVIEKLLVEKIGSKLIEKHKILCGNPNQFQGDERDVIFLTLVDSNENSVLPLRKLTEGNEDSYKKRYNVAMSRAKNQVWIVHSLDKSKDLKSGDIRRELLEFSENPRAFMVEDEVKKKSDSVFEEQVAKYLLARDYNVVQQWEVGAYKIDMVILSDGKKIAIECDGERWHSTEEQIKNDIERQEVLERCGWEFIRIRGSKYFKNPEKTMQEIIEKLNEKEILPEKIKNENANKESYEIIEEIKNRAFQIMKEDERK